MHHMRVSMTARRGLLQAYIEVCDSLIQHAKGCEVCKKEQPCDVWDELHVDFRIAESRSRLLGIRLDEDDQS